VSDTRNIDAAEKESTAASAASIGAPRQRAHLPLEFPVLVRCQEQNEQSVQCNCRTVSVCVDGALLVSPLAVSVGQSLYLTNAKTSQEILCKVQSIQQEDDLKYVSIAFEEWSPEFWEISFPRQEGDPPPNAEGADVRPAKPSVGRSRGLRASPDSRKSHKEDPAAASPVVGPSQHQNVAARPISRLSTIKIATAGLGFLILLAGLWTVVVNRSVQTASEHSSSALSLALPPELASAITGANGFRLAGPEDFAPQSRTWLRNLGQQPSGSIPGHFTGFGESRAYILVGVDKSWRVVILASDQIRCDAQYQSVAMAARIPKEFVHQIGWTGPLPAEPDGDGLLIVPSVEQPRSAVVLFLSGTEVISASPANYGQIQTLPIH
jgi:hypothetical protein